MERRVLNKLKYSLVGAMALAAGVMAPEQVYAQNGNSTEQPTPVITPAPSFVRPEMNQLSQTERPLVTPIFAPSIPIDLSDPDQIMSIAAMEMKTSKKRVEDIIRCESSGDPRKVNPLSEASGWWQIVPNADNLKEFSNLGWDFWKDRFNPYRNTRVAIMIWNRLGWGAWDCR